ncbi:adenine phosphoribosyltransferase [Abyssisolibacter fermentans]|uniref:adenine phosphoribosyltransferase n=1 Tax=Abyssisolibacter fermentans TaxID=1766203 RepID=UPI000834F6D3|nr:adenine phosphoribosyltransferase [Abyssisolibacter fermentans]
MNLEQKIRDIKDYPREGVVFKDITPLLNDKDAFREAINKMADLLEDKEFDLIIGPEARGFLVGAPLSYKLNKGFVPVRKPNKLPYETISFEYELEYGFDILEMHKDAIQPGQKVVIVDDLLATGGTTHSIIQMINKLGGEVVGIVYLIELEFLNGRKVLENYDVKSVIKY